MTALDRIRRLLLQDWDPLGVDGEPQAEDEYDGYALQVYRMVQEGRAASDIASYLDKAWEDLSGDPPTPDARVRGRQVVRLIMVSLEHLD